MPPRVHRNSAWDVSFPEEAPPVVPEKRKRAEGSGIQATYNHRLSRPSAETAQPAPVVNRYVPPEDVVEETPNALIVGEEGPFDNGGDGGDEIPIRLLTDFCIYDRAEDNAMATLLGVVEDLSERELRASGLVSPYFVNEEDMGQEDDDDDDEAYEPLRLRLSKLTGWTIDYSQADDPIYIKTRYAWYILVNPSRDYRPLYTRFYSVYKTAQKIISAALHDPQLTYADFVRTQFRGIDDVLRRKFQPSDIEQSKPIITVTVADLDDVPDLPNHPLIQHILGEETLGLPPSQGHTSYRQRERPNRLKNIALHSLDLAVLRPENQNQIQISPLVSQLAAGIFHGELAVVGPPRRAPAASELRRRGEHERALLGELLRSALDEGKPIRSRPEWRLKPRSPYLTTVTVGGKEYSVGDVVIIPIGVDYDDKKMHVDFPDPDDIPPNATIPDYFWFAQIVFINGEENFMHVRWFEHSSRTMLGELSDPQELFLTDVCDKENLSIIAGKAEVIQLATDASPPPSDDRAGRYFYKQVYLKHSASFVDPPKSLAVDDSTPPDNCHTCLMSAQHEQDSQATSIKGGCSYKGYNLHYRDFVLIASEDGGPCEIGQILRFDHAKRHSEPIGIVARLFGRMSDIGNILPDGNMRSEQELFATDVERCFVHTDIIRPVYALHKQSVPDYAQWVKQSPDHFHVSFHFSRLRPKSWAQRREFKWEELRACGSCVDARYLHLERVCEFETDAERKPLRIFDPFAGVGALSLGLERAGGMKLTHAVEISPSAAQTLKNNCPSAIVYNQCSNEVYRYAVRRHKLRSDETLRDLHHKLLPPPPKPGDIDCIAAGFPCQPHSTLNMFQKANDVKSHLILNLLSWVDFLEPKYCVFENVKGFLQYNPGAVQVDIHRVEGGIEMGGLRFLVHAMLSMNYQIRFGLLQAGHYGTPQTRVRFFLVAARRGLVLPELPQPTHDFPQNYKLGIHFPNGHAIQPIRTLRGTAPFPFVSIKDAIGDLPQFDWENPMYVGDPARKPAQERERAATIPVVVCDSHRPSAGPRGKQPYHSKPQTSFQARCRAQETTDLQHVTRTMKPADVERVITIPLKAGADYRSLPEEMRTWQISNPHSAVAKGGYRPGLYGRLDGNLYFQTTVTNVGPTAKQSKVLHPYLKRIVTVRELARSQGFSDDFVFHSLNGDVNTMFRQIGNAVPLPVGAALGRELKAAMFKKWEQDREDVTYVE